MPQLISVFKPIPTPALPLSGEGATMLPDGTRREVIAGQFLSDESGMIGLLYFEQLVELGCGGKLDANEPHGGRIVGWLLQYAFEQRACNIHLEPRRKYGNVCFCIVGVMPGVYQILSAVLNFYPKMLMPDFRYTSRGHNLRF